MDWQPIETAPKDGTHVLGYGPMDDGTYWMEDLYWYESMEAWPITFMHGHGEPTHWMPLPEPPESESRDEHTSQQ